MSSASCKEKYTQAGAYVQPTQRQILEEKKAHLQKQLKEVEAALGFFDSNPSFEQGLDILSKALR